jgi:hypothetical protein
MLADTEEAAPPPPRRAQAPEQQPFRTAAAEESPLVAVQSSVMPSRAPLPPSRPFDLGTIPGAGEPIAAPRRRQAAMFYAPAEQGDTGAFRALDLADGQGLGRARR